jgi:capsular exopolysaccharide synthesis family protein
MTAYQPIKLPAPPAEMPKGEGLGLDVPHLWAVFRRRFGLFLAAFLATVAMVVIVTFQLTPLYDATARLVINSSETQALDYSSIIAGISPDAAAVDTEVEVILSRKAAAAVADELDLWTDPEFGVDPEAEEGLLSRLVPGQLKGEEPDLALVRQRTIDRLLAATDAERAGITYAIVVTATSEDPQKATAIANAFAERYLTDQLDQKFETYERVNTYLAGAVEKSREELRAAEDAVEAYRTETGLLSAEGTLLSEQQVSDLQAQLIVQEADLAERRAKLTTVERRLALGAGAGSISAVLQSAVIADLRGKQADLTRRRAELETRYGPLHPEVQNVEQEAAELEAQIETETARIVSALENEVRVAENRVGTLRSRIRELEDELATDNVELVRLRELEREADVARMNWQAVRTRSRESLQLADLAEADARIADPATMPVRPAFPDKVLNLALGVLLGLGAGGLAVSLAEIFDQGVRTAADVERQLGTGLVSMVPELSPAKLGEARPEDYVADKPLSAFAESYRTIRSALALTGEADSRVVAVTSAVSGEAKTVSALALARIAALSGDKVVIIDCDLRRRVLSAAFEGEAGDDSRGLAEVLAGAVPLRAAIRKDHLTSLDVLPVAEDRSGLGDLFGGRRFPALLGRLREAYDLVVLDTAPLTAVAETRLAVQAADATILCVRWKETPAALARSAAKVLAETSTPLVGAVLTRVDQRAQAGYGYEGSGRYYSQHGKYYFD